MNIFDGRDIRVVARLFDGNDKDLIITFTGRAANPPVEKGFGESYLIKRRVSAIHFISKDNHWWQTPEPAAAIAELRNRGLIGDGRQITLYGSSMGAYAALMLSGQIKPKRLVLFSPQYSIDAKRVPFEKRWRSYAAKLQFDYDDMAAGIDPNTEIKVVYDPFFKPDRKHVELIEKLRPVDRVPVRFAGHNTARTLEELGIITRVIDDLLGGTFSVQKFLQLYRRTRPASCLFWHGLSQTLTQHRHHASAVLAACAAAEIMLTSGRMKDPVLRRDILRSAIEMTAGADIPDMSKAWLGELEKIESSNRRLAHLRAIVARAQGDWLEVDRQIEAALDRNRADGALVAYKVEATAKLAGPEAGLAYSESLPPALSRFPDVQLIRAQLLGEIRDWKGALEVLQSYTRHDRFNLSARVLGARCWLELDLAKSAMKHLNPILHYHIASDKLADDFARVLERVRSPRHAEKFKSRRKRYKNHFQSLMDTLDGIDWQNREEATEALRSFGRPRPARPQAIRSDIAS